MTSNGSPIERDAVHAALRALASNRLNLLPVFAVFRSPVPN
jgi:hypothetical protein